MGRWENRGGDGRAVPLSPSRRPRCAPLGLPPVYPVVTHAASLTCSCGGPYGGRVVYRAGVLPGHHVNGMPTACLTYRTTVRVA